MTKRMSQIKKGDTVFFTAEHTAFPDFVIPHRATGIVVEENHMKEDDIVFSFRIFMDEPFEGAHNTEWDNCVHINDRDHGDDIIYRY